MQAQRTQASCLIAIKIEIEIIVFVVLRKSGRLTSVAGLHVIDNAINSLINSSASINNTTDDNKFEQ
jgi:multisubunit Na+/H+ antiporter MnhC subunit